MINTVTKYIEYNTKVINMDFDYISLKTQISMYLNHKITLYELGYICENVYYNIIKGVRQFGADNTVR